MKFGITTKISLVLMAVLSLFLFFVFITYFYMLQLHQLFDISARLGLEQVSATRLTSRALLLADPVHDRLLTGKKQHAVRQFARYEREIRTAQRLLGRHRRHIPSEVRRDLSKLNRDVNAMITTGRAILAFSKPADDPQMRRMERRFDRELDRLQRDVDIYEETGRKRLSQEILHAPVVHAAERNLYYAILAAIVSSMLIVILMRRFVTNPINRLHTEVEYVDAGHYDRRIDFRTGDELAKLADAFNTLIDHIQRERLRAAEVQRCLLPQLPSGLPGLRLHAKLLEAKEVGGDWYDFRQVGDHIYMIIGDALGKGMAAALISTLVITTMRLREGPIEDMLKTANEVVMRFTKGSLAFATLLVSIFEPRTGTINFISCGHESPLVYRAETGQWSEFQCTATLPLGVNQINFQPVATTTKLKLGDRVLLITDGLIDARNAERRFFGLPSIFSSLRKTGGLGIDTQIKTLVNDAASFTGQNLTDDIACIGFEFTG